MENFRQLLENLGLNKNEALVYLSCLVFDGAPNSTIAKETKLNRITCYEILKRLERRGFVNSFKKRGVKSFVPTHPNILVKQAKDRLLETEKSVGDLSSLRGAYIKKPKVLFFEGITGIKNIYEDTLLHSKKIFTFTNPGDIRGLLGDKYINSYVKERVKKNITVQGLAPNTDVGKREKENDNESMRATKLFDRSKYSIENEIMIYEDKVALFSGQDKLGIIIESKSIANTLKNIWQIAWDNPNI
jgi:sugar-specific transcriptional regulator TrmB